MTQMHHYAKFLQNWSNGWGDMAIFLIFKMAGVRDFGFLNLRNFNG